MKFIKFIKFLIIDKNIKKQIIIFYLEIYFQFACFLLIFLPLGVFLEYKLNNYLHNWDWDTYVVFALKNIGYENNDMREVWAKFQLDYIESDNFPLILIIGFLLTLISIYKLYNRIKVLYEEFCKKNINN